MGGALRDETKNGCVAEYMSPRMAFFSATDLCGALMINRRNHGLIVFHLYSCSKHKLSMILMAKIML